MTMRALVYDRYGPPETLRLEQVPQPQPAPGEVLVRVHATALNSWDWDLMVGTAMGRVTSPFRPPHKTLGADIAGTVEAVGAGVTTFAPGDAVFGDLSEGKWGGLADYVCAKATALAPIPAGLSFIDAAAIPQAGCLALQALRKRPQLGPSDRVLINGAGGGVGTFAVQMVKALGAHVTAVDRAEKRDALLALGADAFIDYRTTDFTATTDRYDLITDVIANRSAGRFSGALNDGGNLVVIGGTVGSLLQIAALGALIGRKRHQRLGVLVYRASATDSADLAVRCLSGALRPLIDGVYPLELASLALRHLGDGLAVGKVVVSMT
ncbi:MAG: NAD(P)-dependent alcohol dehydrogenase [Devosia sp.]